MSDAKTSYAQKLLDPRWQKIRLHILERDNWQCQNCLNKNETLHVHHRSYRRGAEVDAEIQLLLGQGVTRQPTREDMVDSIIENWF